MHPTSFNYQLGQFDISTEAEIDAEHRWRQTREWLLKDVFQSEGCTLEKAEANLHNDNSAQIPAPPHHSVNEQKLPQLDSCRSLTGTRISRRFVREWIILAQATASPQETTVQVEVKTYDIAALKLKGEIRIWEAWQFTVTGLLDYYHRRFYALIFHVRVYGSASM